MPPRAKKQGQPLGFEETLWKAADTLRGSMDAASYKHVVLGLALLRYISDAFSQARLSLPEELATDGLTAYAAGPLLESNAESTATGAF